MALLNTYVNPQANILYGAGNSKISNAEIKSFVNAMPADKRSSADFRNAMLGNNVSLSQLSQAMGGTQGFDMANLDKQASGLGITKDLAQPIPTIPTAVQPQAPVVPSTINVTPRETVMGNINSIVSDRNNPINVQAETMAKQWANRRGLLDSSIELSAVQDATLKNALPIASADAQTNYDALRANSAQGLQAGMFNAEQSNRTNMFNTEVKRDLYTNQQNMDRDYFIANLDATTRTKIANIDAMSRDSGMMGDISRTYMDLVSQISRDPNVAADGKREAINNVTAIYDSTSSLFPSIKRVSSDLASKLGVGGVAIGGSTPVSPGAGTAAGAGTTASPGQKGGPVASKVMNIIDPRGEIAPEPRILGEVTAYERKHNITIDRSRVVPDAVINGIGKVIDYSRYSNSDSGAANYSNKNVQDMMTTVGAKNYGELFNALFEPANVPGTMRGDQVMFYMYR